MKPKSRVTPIIKFAATAFVAAVLGTSAHAQEPTVLASDNASNYTAGWTTGSNGGTGFGPWTISANPGTGFAGAFTGNAATAGIMLDRVVFPVVNKGADDSLTAVFTFTMS